MTSGDGEVPVKYRIKSKDVDMPSRASVRLPPLVLAAAVSVAALALAWRPALAAMGGEAARQAVGQAGAELRPRVLTGEHDGFSRLVVQLPREVDYRLEQEACGGRIVLTRQGAWPVEELNGGWLRRVWNFRSDGEGRALAFEWACGSSAQAWRERGMVIVDIGAAPMPGRKPGSPAPLPADAEAVLVAGSGEAGGEAEPEPAVPAMPAAFDPGPFALVSSARAETVLPGPLPSETLPPEPPAAGPAGAPTSLLPDASTAARAAPPPEREAVVLPEAVPETPVAASPSPSDGDLEAAVRDGVARALAAFEEEKAAAAAPEAAAPEAVATGTPVAETTASVAEPARGPDEPAGIGLMDVTAWAAGDDRAARIVELTQAAAAAESEARVEALLGLVRLHLAHAMPEEGLAALEAALDAAGTEGSADQRRALRIAGDALRVLAGGADPEDSVFVRLDPPSSADHRLWRAAVLAGPDARPQDWSRARADLPEALRRLLAYPGDLRARLLTRLADGAAAVGDADSLDRIVLEMLTMDAGFAQDRRLDFYRGLVAELRGQQPAALVRYDAAAGAEGPFGRRAQLRAVELRRLSGELDEAGAVEALERLRFAWRGDEVEASTLAALGQAYLRAERTDLVLEMLDRLGRRFAGTPRGNEAAASAGVLISSLLDRPDADTPAQAMYLNRRHAALIEVVDTDGTLRRRLADRLARAGLSLEAGRLLAGLAEDGPEAAREAAALDLAELLLRTDRAGDALAVLAGTSDAGTGDGASALRRALLRGEALAVSNRPLEALDALRDLPGADAARLRARTLFAAGEWRAASAAYDALLDLEGAAALRADDVARLGLAAFRAGDLPAVRDAAARYRPILSGTRWDGLLDILAADAAPFDPAFLGEDEVARQLALADGILGVAGRWGGGAGAVPSQ